jgi:hypothetical protein
MRTFTTLMGAAALSAAIIGAAPAHAVTFVVQTGPFDLPGDPSGVIPANVIATSSNTYEFTFSTIGGTYKTLMQMQTSKVSNGVPQVLTFALFSGTPGSGTFISNSGTGTAATLELNLSPNNYYLELVTSSTAPRELVTGGITLLSTVPEPATWAMMITGVGLLGLAARRRRSLSAAVA